MIWLSLSLMLILQIMLYRNYRIGCIAHPGTWFISAWAFAYLGYYLAVALEVPLLGVVYDQYLLNLLDTFVSVTAGGFLFALVLYHPRRQLLQQISTSNLPTQKHSLYRFFAYLAFSAALLNWVALGANISEIEARRETWLMSVPAVTIVLKFLFIFCYPTALLAGWNYGRIILDQKRVAFGQHLMLLLPMLAGLFWTLGTGGRQALGIVLLYYAVGLVLFIAAVAPRLPKLLLKHTMKKIFVRGVVIAILFTAIINITSLIREKHKVGFVDIEAGFRKYAVVGLFSEVIEYVAVSITSFQLNCNLHTAATKNFGRETFGVLRFFRINSLLGWERRTAVDIIRENEAKAAQGNILVNATSSVYKDIITDFNIELGLFISSVLAIISHIVFVRWLRHPLRKKLISYIPIAILLMFWGYSAQFSMFREEVLVWMFVSFFIWDFLIAVPRPAPLVNERNIDRIVTEEE